MTEEEKIHIAAEKLYEAYGDEAVNRMLGKFVYSEQPEGLDFWWAVERAVLRFIRNGKPA